MKILRLISFQSAIRARSWSLKIFSDQFVPLSFTEAIENDSTAPYLNLNNCSSFLGILPDGGGNMLQDGIVGFA